MPNFARDLKMGFPDSVIQKIISGDSASSLLGSFPRSDTVVMCHGTFDLVHPGHLRHFAFAKQFGSRLIVSITEDAHVTKSNLRPYVPEELRALNLASIELVDFVIIDRNPHPLLLIENLRPDYFVKGYEYQDVDNPRTLEEKRAVEAYGGVMLFSPGDYISSSSAIINSDPPNLAIEKLDTLMKVEGVSFENLHEALLKVDALNVTILGDTIVDSITSTSVIGGFRKTPTPSVRVDSYSQFVGGAGIVAKHAAATGASVNFLTVLGEDELGEWASQDLVNAKVQLHAEIQKDRPTTHKNAIVANNHSLIRVDRVSNSPMDDSLTLKMAGTLSSLPADAVVYSDFRHGIFSGQSIPHYLSAAPKGALRVADSQVASRWGNILDFAGCDLITPNEDEVRFALADQDTVIRPLGSRLYKKAGCQILMLKLGAKGMLVYRGEENVGPSKFFFAVDALNLEPVIDAVGSGDALLAYASLVYRQTENAVVAAILSTIAAGLACEVSGNIPVSKEQVAQRLRALEKLL